MTTISTAWKKAQSKKPADKTAWQAAQKRTPTAPRNAREVNFQKAVAARPSTRTANSATKFIAVVPAAGRMVAPRSYKATLINSNRKA